MYFRWVARVLEHIPMPRYPATSHGRQPRHPPAAREGCCAGVGAVCGPARPGQQPYSEICSPFQAKQGKLNIYRGHKTKILSFTARDCTQPSSMLLQHAADSGHLPGCDRASVTCTWSSKVGVGPLEGAWPLLEAGLLKGGKN